MRLREGFLKSMGRRTKRTPRLWESLGRGVAAIGRSCRDVTAFGKVLSRCNRFWEGLVEICSGFSGHLAGVFS